MTSLRENMLDLSEHVSEFPEVKERIIKVFH